MMPENKPNSLKISSDTQIDLPSDRICMSVDKRDWGRIKRLVNQINDSYNRWENAAWFFSATGISLLFEAFRSSPINSTSLIMGFASLIIAGVLFIASRTISRVITNSKNEVLTQMEEIEENLAIRGLRVLKADYGANGKILDVTTKLNSLIINNTLNELVDNDLSDGQDPIQGVHKTLKVDFILDGIRSNKTVEEYKRLIIP